MNKYIPEGIFIRPGIFEGPIYKMIDVSPFDDTFIFQNDRKEVLKLNRFDALRESGTFIQIFERSQEGRL